MTRIIVILLLVAGVAYFLMQGTQQQEPAQVTEHAEITKMALESEAKAKQAAAIAATDHTAEYEKPQQ